MVYWDWAMEELLTLPFWLASPEAVVHRKEVGLKARTAPASYIQLCWCVWVGTLKWNTSSVKAKLQRSLSKKRTVRKHSWTTQMPQSGLLQNPLPGYMENIASCTEVLNTLLKSVDHDFAKGCSNPWKAHMKGFCHCCLFFGGGEGQGGEEGEGVTPMETYTFLLQLISFLGTLQLFCLVS